MLSSIGVKKTGQKRPFSSLERLYRAKSREPRRRFEQSQKTSKTSKIGLFRAFSTELRKSPGFGPLSKSKQILTNSETFANQSKYFTNSANAAIQSESFVISRIEANSKQKPSDLSRHNFKTSRAIRIKSLQRTKVSSKQRQSASKKHRCD
jgi:hypothetical protein